jgi:hypothetical protein
LSQSNVSFLFILSATKFILLFYISAKWALLDEQYLKIVKAYNIDKFDEFFDKIKLITNFKKTINSNNDK